MSAGRTQPLSSGMGVWLWPEAPKDAAPAAKAAAAISARVFFPSHMVECVWTEEEIEYLIEAVRDAVSYLRSMSPVWRDLESGKAPHII